MSRRQLMPMRMLLALATVVVLVPGFAVAGAGTGGDADDGAQKIVADAQRVEMAIIDAYNARRWEELPALFAEDGLLLVGNEEPIRGRDAIVGFYKAGRDVYGEINDGWEVLGVQGSGNFASLAGVVTVGSGGIRLWYTDLYERQPDGSVQMIINAFAVPKRPAG